MRSKLWPRKNEKARAQTKPVAKKARKSKRNSLSAAKVSTGGPQAKAASKQPPCRSSPSVRQPSAPAAAEPGKEEPSAQSTADHLELERELQRVRESLHTNVEELETSNEELKSSNEELQSTNEELQSANEELETAKEEMQSLNEELTTPSAPS